MCMSVFCYIAKKQNNLQEGIGSKSSSNSSQVFSVGNCGRNNVSAVTDCGGGVTSQQLVVFSEDVARSVDVGRLAAALLLSMAVLTDQPLPLLTIVPALQSITGSDQRSQTPTKNSTATQPIR